MSSMGNSRQDGRAAKVRPTLSDVGRLAGVSAQTVSRYLTGGSYVRAETGERIQRAIDALAYRPNRMARGLQIGRTNTIGVLTAGALNYGAAQTLTGISMQADAADWTMISAHVASSASPDDREAKRAIDRLLSMSVDGILVSARISGLEAILRETVRGEVPVVIIGGRPLAQVDNLGADSYRAGRLLLEHLLGLGHRRIAFLSGPRETDESQERERAYHDAMSDFGVPALPVLPGGDWTSEAGYRVGMQVSFDSFSALFAGDDELALGFLAAARSRGFHAPEDFSIVGIDDMPEAKYFAPPLTTARLDFVSLGRGAFDMLRDRVEFDEPRQNVVINPELIVRSSTAPFVDG